MLKSTDIEGDLTLNEKGWLDLIESSKEFIDHDLKLREVYCTWPKVEEGYVHFVLNFNGDFNNIFFKIYF